MKRIGVDLGGTNIAVGLVDEDGNIILKQSVPTLNHRVAEEILTDMADLVNSVIENSGVDKKDIKSVGIGTPGATNSDTGVVLYANNLGFKNVEMGKFIADRVGLPTYIDNDANCAALGEAQFGATKGVDSSVTITLGTGVGAGVIIDGKIFNGFNHVASELGHTVINFDGVQCNCGRKGCLEQYASATALIRQTKEAYAENPQSKLLDYAKVPGDINTVNARTAFDAMRAGDEVAKAVCEKYIEYIAIGLANVINALQPEVIALGGGVANEGENILAPIRAMIKNMTYGPNISEEDLPRTKLVKATLGNDAGIVGAAMLGD